MARRRSRFVRPAPRTKMWVGMGVGTTTIAGSTTVLESTLGAVILALRPFTILRSHLLLDVRSDQQTAIEAFIGSYGEIVVTEAAAAVGVTAVPDPSAISGQIDADWYIWQAIANQFFIDINGTDGIGLDASAGRQYVIDSKAMRKVGPDDQVVSVITAETGSGYVTTTQGRQLIQLH